MVETINQLRKTTRKLSQELGRRPGLEDLAKAMNCSLTKIKEILAANRTPISLDSPLGEDEDNSLADLVQDENSTLPEVSTTTALLASDIRGVLSTLTPREREIIICVTVSKTATNELSNKWASWWASPANAPDRLS